DRRHFSVDLPELMEDTTLLLDLHDADGIRSRDPVRLVLSARPDEVPMVGLRLHGISSAITADARLPVAGDVHDDYGLTRLWFEYQVEGRKAPGAAAGKIATTEPSEIKATGDKSAESSDLSIGQQPLRASTLAPDGRPLVQMSLETQQDEALDLKRLE